MISRFSVLAKEIHTRQTAWKLDKAILLGSKKYKKEPAAPAIPRRSPIQVLGRPDTG